jgi:hypothetical protein
MQQSTKYQAQAVLQKHLATLPESISLNPKSELVSGLLGAERYDLSSLRREPFHQKFANWRPETDGIVEFTRQYGPLDWDGEFADVAEPTGLNFYFLADHWRERQTEFRRLWETVETEGLKGPTWSLFSMLSGFSVAITADKYGNPANQRGEDNEEQLIWRDPETVWLPGREGPVAHINALTTWQYLCLLLMFEKVERLRKCENPDCAAPYFIARRKDRLFCSEDCAHLIAARRWWKKHGNEWRQARRKGRTRR